MAVRPEAWQIHGDGDGDGIKARLAKRAYLGSIYEYTFETVLGSIFVVSPDLTNILQLGAEVRLSLANHGVSVVQVNPA